MPSDGDVNGLILEKSRNSSKIRTTWSTNSGRKEDVDLHAANDVDEDTVMLKAVNLQIIKCAYVM